MKALIVSWFLAASVVLPSACPEEGGASPPPPVTPTPRPPTQAVSGGFVRYIPNREGDYEWKMEGETATSLSPVSLEIISLTATALSPRLEGLTIQSTRVVYFTDSGVAVDEEARIDVRRENMVLTGKGFLWTPERRRIRVLEDVRLLIKEGGKSGLFPL